MREPPKSTSSRRWMLLLPAAAVVIVARVWQAWEADAQPDRSAAGISAPSPSSTSPREGPAQLDAVPSTRSDELQPPASSAEESRDLHATVRCIAEEDDSPLEGVRAYRRGVAEHGTSRSNGELELPPSVEGALVLWKKGRQPLVLERPGEGALLRLSPATAGLEVRLSGMTFDHRLVRSLVVQRDARLPEGPWSPELEQRALDVYACAGLAPGSYDVYLWIARGQGAPRPYQLGEIELSAGVEERVELDLEEAELDSEQ